MSLNRYLKSYTLQFHSVYQSDTAFLIILCKDNQEAANLHVSCSFYLDFQCADSVSMNLGGGQEFSIENLTVKGDAFEYEYNGEAKNIVFHKKTEHSVHVSMEYS